MQGRGCFTVDRSLPAVLPVSQSRSQMEQLPLISGELVDISELLDNVDIQWMLECESR